MIALCYRCLFYVTDVYFTNVRFLLQMNERFFNYTDVCFLLIGFIEDGHFVLQMWIYSTDDCSMLQMDCLGVVLTNDTKTSTCDDGHVLLTLPLSADKREQCGYQGDSG